jgi:outer membrane immunogenic protein
MELTIKFIYLLREKMLRKTLSTMVGLFVFASSAEAAFYAGVGLGPEALDFKQQGHIVSFDPARPEQGFNVQDNTHLSGTGVFGSIFAGYGHLNGKFYLAGEVNGNLSSSRFKGSNVETIRGTASASKYKLTDELGISILPGFQYSADTLFYARAGYANAHFKVSTSDISLANVSKRLDGFRWGLGIKRAISERFALRMEYNQANYKSASMSTLDPLSSVSKTTKISPLQQAVEFGLVFNI